MSDIATQPVAHVTGIEGNGAQDSPDVAFSYRWLCSCGRRGAWKTRAFQARQGGTRHAALMGKGGAG